MLVKEPSQSLAQDDLAELLNENKEFDRWLKREKRISNYPNARTDRDKRREKLKSLIDGTPRPQTLKRIAETVTLALRNDEELDILQDISDFFRDKLGIEVGVPTSAVSEAETTPSVGPPLSAAEAKVIGRVAPTIRTPITPTEFTFWVKDEEDIHVETGCLVTARNPAGIRVTGLVSDIQAMSDVEGVLDSFYAHAFGRPEEEMPTRLPLVVSAKTEVVWRSDGRTELSTVK